MLSLTRLAFAAALLALASTLSAAETLYGADGSAGNPNCSLLVLDPTNGSVIQNIGLIGFPLSGLACHPVTGELYGSTGSGAAPSLISIDTTTGQGTVIGSAGSLGAPMADLAFRGDGRLYGWSEGSDTLQEITNYTSNPTPVTVGPFGFFTRASGLSFDASDRLWFAGESYAQLLDEVDPDTGARIGQIGLSRPGEYNAMAHNSAGILFGSERVGFGGGARNLVTINESTGQVTTLGSTINALDAICFCGEAAAQAPGSSPATLAITIGVILLAMLFMLYRRAA